MTFIRNLEARNGQSPRAPSQYYASSCHHDWSTLNTSLLLSYQRVQPKLTPSNTYSGETQILTDTCSIYSPVYNHDTPQSNLFFLKLILKIKTRHETNKNTEYCCKIQNLYTTSLIPKINIQPPLPRPHQTLPHHERILRHPYVRLRDVQSGHRSLFFPHRRSYESLRVFRQRSSH